MKQEERPKAGQLEQADILKWVQIAAIAVIGCLCVKYSGQVFGIAGMILHTAKPLVYGFVIAYVLNIFMKRMEKYYFPKNTKPWMERTRRPVCVFSSVILVLLILVFLIVLVVPALADSVHVLTKDIPKTFLRFQAWLVQLLEDVPEIQDYVMSLKIEWNLVFEKISSVLTKGIGSLFNSAFSVANIFVSFAFTGAVSVIFAIYMLFGKERLKGQMRKLADVYFPYRIRDGVQHFLGIAHETFTDFISGQILEAFILGSLCAGGMVILKLPYALMCGVTVGITALIPVMGAYIGAIFGAFMIVTISPLKALEFLIYLTVLQQVEGNLIYPRVVGGSIGLPGIWVLAAVTIGGGLFGVPGMLIGVPLTATLYKWMRENVGRKLAKKDAAV